MQSDVAAAIAREDRERILAMTPAERVEFAIRLSQEGLAAPADIGPDPVEAVGRWLCRSAGRGRATRTGRSPVVGEVEAHIDAVKPDIRAAWRELLRAVPDA